MPKIDLGLSGSEFYLRTNPNLQTEWIATKKFATRDQFDRFVVSRNRLQTTLEELNTNILLPEIYDIAEESLTVRMQFVKSPNLARYVVTATQLDLKKISASISMYLQNMQARGEQILAIPMIEEKIDELEVKLTSIAPLPTLVFKALEKTRQLIASNSNEQIYSGVGHGDFTLENMIWSNQRLYLIDNISTYMEGPSADAVKLEQDLLDNWFLRIYPFGSNERVRGFISSTTITNFVKEDLARCNPNHDLRLAMRIVNLLRIFPYARNLQDKTHLSVILTKLLERRTDELS